MIAESIVEYERNDKYKILSFICFQRNISKLKKLSNIYNFDFCHNLESIRDQKNQEEKLMKNIQEFKNILKDSYSAIFSIKLHIIILRLFVESILLYGFPQNYCTFVIKSKTVYKPIMTKLLYKYLLESDLIRSENYLKLYEIGEILKKDKIWQESYSHGLVPPEKRILHPFVNFSIDL